MKISEMAIFTNLGPAAEQSERQLRLKVTAVIFALSLH